ncbi:MAG: glycine C-acetyltransferase [Christensenellales bacterium]|nr:glycine C-acetyltransferase [Clostridiales bacterium]MDY5726696.1 glycine C-acetyltransferase [Eubacteriales bacterium]
MLDKKYYQGILDEIKNAGLWKEERIITTPQSAQIDTTKADGVLNFCANNYLGLANNQELIEAAKASYDKYGYGMSSVRFICGTQTIHKELEEALSKFLSTEDTILYSSCFDANGGLFETITTADDAIISDALNHASIIDGVRLSKAHRYRYANNDMEDLEKQLKQAIADGCKQKVIVTDGVFSMDGIIANLKGVCDLAEKYGAMVVVDDSHATGFVGPNGRGTAEYCGVVGRVDIITGTFGKALGGASGGFTSGRREIIDLLRQRSRPYLFSNTVAPAICATTLKVLEMLTKDTSLRDKVMENARYFRSEMEKNNFNLIGKDHAIIPVMLYDAVVSQKVADLMLKKGIYVTGFFYPVVPKDKARIRTQMSAAHSKEDIDKCVKAFVECREEIGF